ncbi:MAG: hypothetical protein IKK24_01010, partial [Clostridia bacterium]|nr:hypothetical protein [Clostridia bacterium]
MNFKRILLILTSVIATLALTVACLPLMSMADDQIVVKNNAYEDFSTTQNPSGVWSYEYRVKNPDNSYTYTPLTFDGSVWGSDALGTITTTASCMETYKPALRFKASNDLVTELVLTYTAPENGTVQVIMDNGGVFSTTRNADNYIRFSMLHNGRVIKNVEDLDSDYNAFNPFFGDAQVLTVKKNDIIRFVVGKNAASRGTINTDMNPVINYALVEAEKPTEYEAAAEYKSGSVDGQWRYYSRNSAGLYAPLAVNGNFWGVGANCSIDYTDADSITGKRAINMHSGLDLDPTLAFVAPFTGTMEVSMANGGVYCPNSGFDGVNLTVYINDTLYFESKVNSVNSHEGYRVWADVKTITVTAGDIIYFSINKNANTSGDVVFLNPYIKYTEVIGEYDSTLRFLDTDVIETTNLYKDSFDISWPAARGGIADFTYEVFASKTPITGIPTEGGIDVGATRMYSFTGLEAGTAYYIAVVATDGVSKAVLYNNNPVNTISKMFVFNAYDDYKTENQKSPWGYEALSSEKHQKLDWNNGIWGNEATTGAVYSATSDLVTGKPALVLSPSSSGAAVLTFTAPYTGTLDISIANGGIMVPYNGEGNGYDGVNFKLTQNEKVIVKHDAVSAANCHSSAMGAFYKGRLFTETLNLSVKAGDIIRFTVDMNKATGNDMTFINPEIIYTSVVEGALDLHFEEGKQITGSGITKSEITVIIPTAFGGTGNYEYTLYTSKKPITAIPSSGGIKLGENSSYTLKGLTAYTNYYFAATVSDGTNTASIINSKAISTIGNTYTFNACEDWSDKGQPINTPWRYYMQEIETGKYTEMSWNSEQASFEDKAIAPSIS